MTQSAQTAWEDKPGSILWIDVETTHKNPACGRLFELGILFTDRRGRKYPADRVPQPFNTIWNSSPMGEDEDIDPTAMLVNRRNVLFAANSPLRRIDTDTADNPDHAGHRRPIEEWKHFLQTLIAKHCQDARSWYESEYGECPSTWPISIGGWNTVFDTTWIYQKTNLELLEFSSEGNWLDYTLIDVKQLIWAATGKRHRLRSAAEELLQSDKLGAAHRATDDVECTAELFALGVEHNWDLRRRSKS